jgi:hypothetical protein
MNVKLCDVCKRAIHSLAECPVQRAADEAENGRVAIAGSAFAHWASNFVSSLAALAAAGVQLGSD